MFAEPNKLSIDASLEITPDDVAHTELRLRQQPESPAEPYGVTAVLFGLALLLLLRIISPGNTVLLALYAICLGTSVCAYVALLFLRLPLPRLGLSVAAAVLAMLLSLNSDVLFLPLWRDWSTFSEFLLRGLLAASIGLLLGVHLDVQKYPTQVIAISFLVVFLLAGMGYIGMSLGFHLW